MTSSVFMLLFFLQSATPQIDVVYPRIAGQDTIARIQRVESNFIFGSVSPFSGSWLSINDTPVPLFSNGAFLSYLPVDWINKRYILKAWNGQDTSQIEVRFAEPLQREIQERPELTFPCAVKITSSPIRNDIFGTYYLFPDSGTYVMVSDWQDGFFKIELYPGQNMWVDAKYVQVVDNFPSIEAPVVWNIKCMAIDDAVRIRIPMNRKVLYRVWDEGDPGKVCLELYGVVSHLDLIKFPANDDFLEFIRWSEPFDNVLQLEISLSQPLGGYFTTWDSTALYLTIKKQNSSINDLSIAIDPGHGGNSFGAIGPTRLAEKDVNLRLSRKIVEYFISRGANAWLTRENDYDIGLNERIRLAEERDADLLISIHHNALPDGIDPFYSNFGTGTYFYRRQSQELAIALQNELVESLQLPNEGVYYKDLAITRITSMPSVLIELAYMIIPEQERLLRSEQLDLIVAQSIYRAVKNYTKTRKIN